MPGGEPLLLAHAGEEPASLLALDRDGAQAVVAIPAQDHAETPLAEPAVGVVQECVLFGQRLVGGGRGAVARLDLRGELLELLREGGAEALELGDLALLGEAQL